MAEAAIVIPTLGYTRLPRLLRERKVTLADYTWNWIGLFGSIVFVLAFLYGVEALGKRF
jgi:hypothetical protein